MVLEQKIIPDFSEESLDLLKGEMFNKYSRAMTKEKVLEYKEIFEELAKIARYYIPDVSTFPKILILMSDVFSELTYSNLVSKPKYREILTGIVEHSRMMSSVELSTGDEIYFDLTGENPYSLLWYSKIAACMLSISKMHWEIIKTVPEELHPMDRIKKIRLYLRRGESMKKSLEIVENTFAGLNLRLRDLDNRGIWELFNTPSQFLMDHSLLSYIAGSGEGIPFKQTIDDINNIAPENSYQRAHLILELYNKVHLISQLESRKNRLSFRPAMAAIKEVLEKTLSYSKIAYSMEAQGPNLVITHSTN